MRSAGLKNIFIIALFSVVFLMFNCTSQLQKNPEGVSIEQKEQDLISLLQSDQSDFQATSDDPETESLQQRISELEQDNRASLEEINRLRSELLLKDQRINELEERTGDEPGTTEEKPAAVRPVKTMTGYELSYSQALDLFKRRKYRESIGGFSSLLANDKNNSYSDNCQYWIGECYFALRNYHEAVVA
ncbi:MAG: hypothetical protein GY863_02215, partial [bacterium]|nr:hypothetical protein [bacterium]